MRQQHLWCVLGGGGDAGGGSPFLRHIVALQCGPEVKKKEGSDSVGTKWGFSLLTLKVHYSDALTPPHTHTAASVPLR